MSEVAVFISDRNVPNPDVSIPMFRVPFFMRGPGITKDSVVASLVGNTDIFPTGIPVICGMGLVSYHWKSRPLCLTQPL